MADEITYGPWCPTAYLRWKNGRLQQKMRRKVKRHHTGMGSWRAGYDYEWQDVPSAVD